MLELMEKEFHVSDPLELLNNSLCNVLPQRRDKLNAPSYKKIPKWRYENGRLIVRTIKEEDTAQVIKFFMEEYILINPIMKNLNENDEIEAYKMYRDILINTIPEENSFMAIEDKKVIGVLIANLKKLPEGKFYDVKEFFDPKLSEVIDTKSWSKILHSLLDKTYIKKLLHIRFLVTKSDNNFLDSSRVRRALLRSFWAWSEVRTVDCVLAINRNDGQKTDFKAGGYQFVNALSRLAWRAAGDRRDDYGDPGFEDINRICFFLRIANDDCRRMYEYQKACFE